MMILVNHKLPPILQFISGSKRYVDIIYQLWSDKMLIDQFSESDGDEIRADLVLSSKYFVEPSVLKSWIRRLKHGRLNVKIVDGQDVVFSYFSSKFGVDVTYQVAEIESISLIDYAFVKERFNSFRSRSKNTVELTGGNIKKSSTDIEKIKSEYFFIEKNGKIFDFYPPVRHLEENNGAASYQMPLIVPGDISSKFLEQDCNFFKASKFSNFCIDYFERALSEQRQQDQFLEDSRRTSADDLLSRMHTRSKEFNSFIAAQQDVDGVVLNYISYLHKKLVSQMDLLFRGGSFSFVNRSALGVLHGDFCLSNILYEGASKQFFLIDPRGDSSLPVCMDLAKLAHSLHGGYDFLLAGHYKLLLDSSGVTLDCDFDGNLSDIFWEIHDVLGHHTKSEIILLEAYLFLTMVKFHHEDLNRCLAFLVRARDLLSEVHKELEDN